MLSDKFVDRPMSENQEDILYAAKLYSAGKTASYIFDKLTGKSKKEQLEEQILQRQLDAMGDDPSTADFNKAMLLGRQLPNATGFLADLFKGKATFPYLPPSMANVIPIGRNSIKSAILRSVK